MLRHTLVPLALAVSLVAAAAPAAQPPAATAPARAVAPRATGGPDQFGYTWDDSVPFAWIDATGGTALPVQACGDSYSMVSIPFPFTYYGGVKTYVLVAYDGYAGFDPGWDCWPQRLPSSWGNNGTLAPYWSKFADGSGTVFETTGGSAPDRWLAIEWHDMVDGADPTSTYTFELILHEGGEITFQHLDMAYGSSWRRSVTGIEDLTGYDGLLYQDGDQITSGTAVRFSRPAPAARVFAYPSVVGRLVAMSQPDQRFSSWIWPVIRNTGDLGDDTFDLTFSSTWPMTFLGFTDHNGNGIPDTGVLFPQNGKNLNISIDVPRALATSNTAVVTATSSLDPSATDQTAFQAAVPARFVQAHGSYRLLRIATPPATTYAPLQPGDWTDYRPTVLELPDGKLLYTWALYVSNGVVYVSQIWCAILDRSGNTLVGPFVIDDRAGLTYRAWLWEVATAVAPDGRIGMVWHEDLYDDAKNENDNVYFAVIDDTGQVLVPPINVTNNAAFGKDGDLGVPFVRYTKIAATAGNRFLLTWQKESTQTAGFEQNVYSAVYDSTGAQVQGVVNRSAVPAGTGTAGCPGIGELSSGGAALAYSTTVGGQIEVHQIDSDGAETNAVPLGADGCFADLVELGHGNLLVGYIDNGVTSYAVLAPDLSIVSPAAPLPNATGEPASLALSVTTDARGNGILTWEESQLYNLMNYAYVDSTGNILTPPTVFWTGTSGPFVSHNGSAVTTYRPFVDVPVRSFAAGFIERLLDNGVTAGCGDDNFCPFGKVSRAQMAVFLLVSEHGSDYTPPPCTGVFTDVPCPGGFAVDWIEQLAAEGITAGCGPDTFCPDDDVTRAQMAVFLLAAEHGSGYTPPPCAGLFTDVPCPGGFAVDWIEQLAAEGITAGCGGGRFCPGNPVLRSEMAVFLSTTFNLP